MKNLNTFLALYFISTAINAQVVNQSDVFSITEGTTLSIVNQSFTNQATMTNEGELIVDGDWINEGDYISETGSLQMDSDQEQMLDHNAQSFHNLVISGGGIKIIENNFTVNHTLTLDDGKILAENGAQLIMASGSNLVGGNENSYIIGELIQSGAGEILFPIGTETQYLPAIVLDNKNPLEPIGIMAIDGMLQQSAQAFAEISQQHYWKLNSNNETVSGVQFRFSDENFSNEIDNLTLAYSPDDVRSLESLGDLIQNNDLYGIESAVKSGYYAFAIRNTEKPSIRVINVITAKQDGKHDFLRIENIEYYEDNKVEIYNRAGVLVFSMSNYNNQDRVFRGTGNEGFKGELMTGNYVYTVKMGSKVESGFIFLKQ